MIELEISFEGETPGVHEHRLSVDAFGEPLSRLLLAARRIATQIVTQAIDATEDYGSGGGRWAKEAGQLDIQITTLEAGSLRLVLALLFNLHQGKQLPLFDDLPERTGSMLLEAIRDESAGSMRNHSVRKYLASLPPGITSQEYALLKDGQRVGSVAVGEVKLAELPRELPGLVVVDGVVVGVGFEPGRPEVRVRAEATNRTIVFVSTPERVEAALKLRNAPVRAQAVAIDGKLKLLSIRGADDTLPPVTSERVQELVFDKWHELLKKLA